MGVKGGVNMKGSDTFKKIPKNFWIVGIAIVGGYMLYRNIQSKQSLGWKFPYLLG
jgi:hypothetical protein